MQTNFQMSSEKITALYERISQDDDFDRPPKRNPRSLRQKKRLRESPSLCRGE